MAVYTQGRRLHEIPASTAMSREVYSCQSDDSLIEAEETMRSRKVRRLPVLDSSGQLCGVLSLNDLAREAEREVGRRGRQGSFMTLRGASTRPAATPGSILGGGRRR